MVTATKALRGANLNLIPVLRVLLKESSVSRASEALGMSQSATSGALAQLRTLLGDPILVQVGRSMRLTPRAQELIGPLEQLCGDLEALLHEHAFDPAHTEREFVVAAPDFMTILTGNRIIDTLRAVAPKVSVSFTEVSPDLADRLASGAVDLGVVDMGLSSWKGVAESAVYTDRQAVIVGVDHPIALRGRCAIDDLRLYPQVSWRGSVAPAASEGTPAASSTPIYSRHFSALPFLALKSDCLAIVPRLFAERMAQLLPLAVLDLPYPTRSIQISLVWSTVHESDPAHHWFRRTFESVLAAAAGR